MSVLDDIGGVINDVRLIIQSNPERLNDFAQRWAQVGGAVQGQQPVVNRGITDVEFDSEGALAKQMTRYRLQMGDGMNQLGGATMEVSDALRAAAPKLAAIRKDLIAAAVGAGLTVAALAIPVVGEVLEGLVAGGEIVTIVNLVNDYNTEMTALSSSFTSAQAKMQALDTLNNAGGVLPDAPQVSPGDVGPGTTDPNSTSPGTSNGQSPGGDDSGSTGSGGDNSGSSTPGGDNSGSTTPGGTTPGSDQSDPGTPSSTGPGTTDSSGATPDTAVPSSLDTSNSGPGSSSVPNTMLSDPSLSSSIPSTLDTRAPVPGTSNLNTPGVLTSPQVPTTPTTAPSTFVPSTFTPSTSTPVGGTSSSAYTPLGATGGSMAASTGNGNPRNARESASSPGTANNEPAPTLSHSSPPSGSSSSTSSGGFFPPMMPPMMGAGGMGSGGVRPGEAGSRGGAALRPGGRDARRAALRPGLSGRAGDGEEKRAETFPPSDGNLLDEELWQVPGGAPVPAPPEPGRRRSSRGA